MLQCFQVVFFADHHQAGCVGHIPPLLEIDGEGISVMQFTKALYVLIETLQGGFIDIKRVFRKIVFQKKYQWPADSRVHVNVRFGCDLVELAKFVAQNAYGFHAVHTEGVGCAHGEHDHRNHATELEAGRELALQILHVHVIIVCDADADRFAAQVHA